MNLVMNASRNEKYVEANSDMVDEIRKNEDGTSSFSGGKIKEVYIPPEEVEELLKMFSTSVVQDFGDDYHLTRKEREEMQERYQKFFRLKKNYTRKIRKLDKFVEAYRLCMEIINDIAATNGLYDPKEFRKKALNGTITIEGLHFPKFQGKRKKKINWEHVTEYIMDPSMDIRELTEIKELAEEAQIMTDDSVMSKSELEKCLEDFSEKEEDYIEYQSAIGSAISANGTEMGKKEQKWLAKKCPTFIQSVKDASKQDASETRRHTHAWDISDDEMEVLQAYDSKIRGKNSTAMPEFSGNFMSSKAVDAYLYALDEYEKENSFVNYNGRLLTEAECEEMEYMRALEENGWNIRNLYDNRNKAKETKKAKAADRKRVETLKKMLTLAQTKEDYRSKGYSEKEIEKLIAKQESVGKKNKKKKKKGKKAMESIILDVVGSQDKNFKKYKKRMGRM